MLGMGASYVLNRMVQVGVTEKMTFQQRRGRGKWLCEYLGEDHSGEREQPGQRL